MDNPEAENPFLVPDEITDTNVFWNSGLKFHIISMLMIVLLLFPIQLMLNSMGKKTTWNHSFKFVIILCVIISSIHAIYFMKPNTTIKDINDYDLWHTIGYILLYLILFIEIICTIMQKYCDISIYLDKIISQTINVFDIINNWFLLPYICMVGYANICLGNKYVAMYKGQLGHPLIGLMWYNYGCWVIYNIHPINPTICSLNKLTIAENIYFTFFGSLCIIIFYTFSITTDKNRNEHIHQLDYEHITKFVLMTVAGIVSIFYNILYSFDIINMEIRNKLHSYTISFAFFGMGIGALKHGYSQSNSLLHMTHSWIAVNIILCAIARFFNKLFVSGFLMIFFGISLYISGPLYVNASYEFWRINILLHFMVAWILAFYLGNITFIISQIKTKYSDHTQNIYGSKVELGTQMENIEMQPFLKQ
eukprot:424526_1